MKLATVLVATRVASLPLATGCVSSARYDADIVKLQQQLDSTKGDLARLQDRSGKLSSNLETSQRELEQVRRLRAAAEAPNVDELVTLTNEH